MRITNVVEKLSSDHDSILFSSVLFLLSSLLPSVQLSYVISHHFIRVYSSHTCHCMSVHTLRDESKRRVCAPRLPVLVPPRLRLKMCVKRAAFALRGGFARKFRSVREIKKTRLHRGLITCMNRHSGCSARSSNNVQGALGAGGDIKIHIIIIYIYYDISVCLSVNIPSLINYCIYIHE